MQHHKIAHKLKQKGWEDHYVSKSLEILKKAEKKKHPTIKKLDNVLHIIVLFLTLIGNAAIIYGILPIIVNMPTWVVLLIVSIIGFTFGLMIDHVIKDIEIAAHHYIIAGTLISLIGTGTLFYIIEYAKSKLIQDGIYITINPLIVMSIYLVSFAMPHILYKIKEHKKYGK